MYKCRLDLDSISTAHTCIRIYVDSTKREREREKTSQRNLLTREGLVVLESERGIDHKLPFPQIEQDIKRAKKSSNTISRTKRAKEQHSGFQRGPPP